VARSNLFATSAVQDRWKHFLAGSDTREWSRVWSLAMLIAFVNRQPVFKPHRDHTPAVS
jgi:asparagine synthase (glutamine-hydrolysing)